MIRVHDLRYRYPGAETRALDGLDFEVDSGEILGLVGPSGAGKSTTQKVLSGLLDGYEGKVTAFGREVREWGSDYYEHVGVSAESPNHYLKLTGAENLELFASLYGETRDARALLGRVGLADAADRRVSDYSKGMRMRLNFVRALLHDPEMSASRGGRPSTPSPTSRWVAPAATCRRGAPFANGSWPADRRTVGRPFLRTGSGRSLRDSGGSARSC